MPFSPCSRQALGASGLILLFTAAAFGQTVSPQGAATPPAQPPAQSANIPATPSIRVNTSFRPRRGVFSSETPIFSSSELTVLTTSRGRLAIRGHGASSSEDWSSAHGMAGFGPSWDVGADVVYHTAGGWTLIAGASGRRGYSLPSYASMLPDGSTLMSSADRVTAATSLRPVLFETRLAIERPLVQRGHFSVTAVGEALNLLNPNKPIEGAPLPSTFTAKAYRASLRIRF